MAKPGNPVYNLHFSRRIEGPLDVNSLERSFTEIARRHEALRTHFAMADGQPVQVVTAPGPVCLLTVDLTSLAAPEKEEEVYKNAVDEARYQFDLSRGPLFRCRLLRLSDNEHVLLLTMRHIIGDAWSLGVLVKEVAILYEAFSAGKPSPLPDLPIQYADYAAWQRNWLQGKVLEDQLVYWKRALGDDLQPLNLPTERPRPPLQNFRGARERFQLTKRLSDRLMELSQKAGCTLFMTLLAAFQVLLSRYSRQEDIAVGTPVANRTRSEVEGLIGFFVNMVVLRADLSGDPTVSQLLAAVKEGALGAFAHQDLPFEKLVEEMNPRRDPSRHPLFQALFALHNAPQANPEMRGLALTPLQIDAVISRFDLSLDMNESPDGLRGAIEYSIDLFDPATITRMGAHFQNLLEAIVANPDARISELRLMDESERRRALIEWSATGVEYEPGEGVIARFERHAAITPDKVAVVCEDRMLSYAELNRGANQLAHYLVGRGVGPEASVSICVERGPDLLIALLGVLKAGGRTSRLTPHTRKSGSISCWKIQARPSS